MRPSHPPRPGVRRRIDHLPIDTKERQDELRHRIDTIQKCGLAAEVETDGSWLTIYATRRTRTHREEKK